MDYCTECNMQFNENGLRTGAQKITGHGHGRFPKLQYCPQCKRTYDLGGNPLSINGNSVLYFDENYFGMQNGVACWGQIVTKNELSKK